MNLPGENNNRWVRESIPQFRNHPNYPNKSDSGDGTVLSESAALDILSDPLVKTGKHSSLMKIFSTEIVDFITEGTPNESISVRRYRNHHQYDQHWQHGYHEEVFRGRGSDH